MLNQSLKIAVRYLYNNIKTIKNILEKKRQWKQKVKHLIQKG